MLLIPLFFWNFMVIMIVGWLKPIWGKPNLKPIRLTWPNILWIFLFPSNISILSLNKNFGMCFPKFSSLNLAKIREIHSEVLHPYIFKAKFFWKTRFDIGLELRKLSLNKFYEKITKIIFMSSPKQFHKIYANK
jgi:hypothetical protein